ncbi:UBP-type zinc finger domain-containing protein [Streptomyces sp. NPDC085612]|uniref:UBP-type zinc finger domain-containing protein n=1 Tax=Streptomyces sp. NPDC085612 TaxID=3365732 RepID=UPI0037CED340
MTERDAPQAWEADAPEADARQGDTWEVAPDAGRPDGRACDHLELLVTPWHSPALPSAGCSGCLPLGWSWVRLRQCVTCGYLGCCDSSKGRHAHAHHEETGHPVVVSTAPDEDWAWCYDDEVFLVRAGGHRPGSVTARGRR